MATAIFETLERRQLLSAAANWVISGGKGADAILVDYSPTKTAWLRATVNGKVISTRLARTVKSIEVFGGDGNDRITVDLGGVLRGIRVWANGQAGKDKLVGGAEGDMFMGGSSRDTLVGGAGDDSLRGGTGSDDLIGDDGNDYLQGNAGNDTLAGGWGDDKETGGTGNDQIRGGGGADSLWGGKDADVIKGGDRQDTIEGGAAADTLYVQKKIDAVGDTTGDRIRTDSVSDPLDRLSTEDELKKWVIDESVQQWSWAFGQPKQTQYWAYDLGMVARSSSADGLLASAPDTSSSSTNTQVQGVDEADREETDGQYLYLLRGGNVVIADASPAKDLKVVSKTSFDGYATGMYLSGTRVAVISNVYKSAPEWRGRLAGDSTLIGLPVFSTPQFRVTVFDVFDPAAPKTMQNTVFDGSANDSRVIDGRLYLVVQNYLSAPAPETSKNDNGDEIYETEATYRARLEAGAWKDLLPKYTGKSADGSATAGGLFNVPNVYVRDGDRLDVTTVALVDLGSNVAKPVSTTSVAGADGTVYASRESLYLAGYNWDGSDSVSTDVIKFSLGVDQVTLEATGSVRGDVLNSFSMDEKGRNFRIATTYDSGDSSSSAITVLDQVGDDLAQIGQVEGLADGEQIYGARFMGDRAYIVTFRQVDPLFTIDMTDATAPKVVGTLKVPGVSNYLFPLDAAHLIGVGQSGDDTGRLHGVQLSLFDVTDLANPKQVDTYSFGSSSEWTTSPAMWDPHSFSYFPEYSVLALPVSGQGTREQMEVFKVDPVKGFTLLGGIAHEGQAQRSVRIGNVIYSIGSDGVKAYALTDLKTEISHLDLPDDWDRGPLIDWGKPVVMF
jgi:uncharacterized secreted protein with C-terminal beta-propeller domain